MGLHLSLQFMVLMQIYPTFYVKRRLSLVVIRKGKIKQSYLQIKLLFWLSGCMGYMLWYVIDFICMMPGPKLIMIGN